MHVEDEIEQKYLNRRADGERTGESRSLPAETRADLTRLVEEVRYLRAMLRRSQPVDLRKWW